MSDQSYIVKIATLQLIYVMILVCIRKATTEIHSYVCVINCLNETCIFSTQDAYT